ncbi:MAG: VCBS repeat-containing protein, partial [Bacteroidota bacterium]
HKEDFHVDFYIQSLLPHQFTQLGPALAKADLNGDGLEDFYVGGASSHAATFFIQTSSGEFEPRVFEGDEAYEDVDALFFDADGDTDLDLYVVSGGSVSGIQVERYQDRLYLNDGKGNFHKNLDALPEMYSSTACVKAADYDGDGDEDLFIGGRLVAGKYPNIPQSYLLENQGGRFVDVTEKVAKDLQHVGMVTDAEWADINQDEKPDLVLLGEWMPISTFLNTGRTLKAHKPRGLSFSEGWWNCIEGADFDGDGDMDFLAGNLGLNTNYRAKEDEPVCIYAKDFDKNGSIDPILCQFIRGEEYPIASRDNLIKQLPYIESRFSDYKSYAKANFAEVFSKEELADALILKAHNFQSAYIENLGNGEFTLHKLAPELQIAPIQDIWSGDVDGDDIPDALLIGNAYDTEVKIGRYDAFKGVYLKGLGDGIFEIMSGPDVGFLADKNARKLVKIERGGADPKEFFVLANNADSLQVFTYNQNLSE